MTISTPDWVKDAVFYQIFPDRFASSTSVSKQGLHLEAWDHPPTPYGFKGGDLLGITEHLDYLQDLGITAIYLNPVFSSASNHRYHTYDYYTVDPLLGGNAAFRTLLDAAHQRKLRVILDGVFNHASRGFWQFHHVLENGAGSPYVDWFHFNRDYLYGRKHWGAYPTKDERQQLSAGKSSLEVLGYEAWMNLPALPKFNTQTAAVREFLWDVSTHWLKFGIDGWRLDVPNEIDDDSFWQEFRRRIKSVNPEAYLVAELWNDATRWLQGDQFDAVMNYRVTAALLGFLLRDKLDDTIYHIGDFGTYLQPLDGPAFKERIDFLLGQYDPAINQVQLNLLDSHDTPRFLTSANGDRSALELGWLFLFTYPGTPCIFYGDEIGLQGGHDPGCRQPFPWDVNRWNQELLQYTKSLVALRKAHPALRTGTLTWLSTNADLVAYGRTLDSESCIVVINSSTQTQLLEIPVESLNWQPDKVQVLFGKNETVPQLAEGVFRGVRLAPRSGLVLGN
ncbi:MAG: glycoside hydrolase family 13 protein [Anaerolineae bacterium]